MHLRGSRKRRTTVALLLATCLLAGAAPAPAQVFLPQGPAPSVGPTNIIQSGDLQPGYGTVSGAVQSILVSPVNPGTMYIGTVNGGVWSTTNGGSSWTPLSDRQRSLSIAALGFDPNDSKTLIAGIGTTSNMNIGGENIGLLYSRDGGSSWKEIAVGPAAGKNIVGVLARGDILLAASANPQKAAETGGLFRSIDGGKIFAPVTLGKGGDVAVTALAADPGQPSLMFAAQYGTKTQVSEIYVGTDNGKTWGATPVLTLATGEIARLATGPGGAVAVAGYTGGVLTSLKLSQNAGGSWANLEVPTVTTGKQAATDLALAIDPTNTNIVYVAGDAKDDPPHTLPAFRVTLRPDGTSSSPESLTDENTSNGSTVHADARNFAFDANGRLLMVGDGGVYVRTNPQGNDGTWSGLNSLGLRIRESYAVAYDAVSKRLMVAAQDTGVAYQTVPNGDGYAARLPADGLNAVVNDRTVPGRGVFYSSIQNLGLLTRTTVDSQGVTQATKLFGTRPGEANFLGFHEDDYSVDGDQLSLPFSSRFVLNRNDPTHIAIGTNYIYTTVDTNAASATLSLTSLAYIGPVSALAYGTRDDVNALIAGGTETVAGKSKAVVYRMVDGKLTKADKYDGGTPTSLVFNTDRAKNFYVADGTYVRQTDDNGTSFFDATPDKTKVNLIRPTSLEFISKNGVSALLVGGLSDVAPSSSPIAVGNVDPDLVVRNFSAFGSGLPNTLVNTMTYNDTVDVLAVSLVGRGIWLLYDVTSYFDQAVRLDYGLANNDSTPPVGTLTNGIAVKDRPLNKYGSGRLTIGGETKYSGPTTIFDGQLLALGNLTSSPSVQVNASGSLAGTGIVSSVTVDGTLAPGNPMGTLQISGNLAMRPGSTYRVIQSGSATSLATVGGGASLSGTVQAVYGGGAMARNYTILTTTGGRTGTFDSLALTNFPGFLSGSLAYGTNDVTLNLQSGMANTAGLAGNQASVGRVLDAAFNSGPGWTAMPALFGLSSGQVMNALSMLSGDNASVGQVMGLSSGAQFAGLLGGRGNVRRAAPTQLSEACDTAAADATCGLTGDWSAWVSGFGGAQWLNADAMSGSASSVQTIAGTAFGSDYRLGPQTLLGIAIGMSASSYSIDSTNASGRAGGTHVGIYGQQTWPSFYVNGAVSFARFDGGATRFISGVGTPETARSTVVSHGLAERVEIGRPFAVAEVDARRVGVTPFVAIEPSQLWTPAFSETSVTINGAPGAFALSYQAQGTASFPSLLGAQLDVEGTSAGKPFHAWFRAAWVHEFLTSRSVSAGFNVLPGATFTVDGAPAAADAARLSFGTNIGLTEQVEFYANGLAEISSRGQSLAATVGFRVTW